MQPTKSMSEALKTSEILSASSYPSVCLSVRCRLTDTTLRRCSLAKATVVTRSHSQFVATSGNYSRAERKIHYSDARTKVDTSE